MDLQPTPVPDHLLDDPKFVHALAARDFTTVFAMTSELGLSFYRIGQTCGMKDHRVAKVARGEGEVTSLVSIERIADGLRIPGALLGLAARPWERPSAVASPEFDKGDDPMERRTVLRSVLAAGAGLAGPALTHLTATREALDQELVADSRAHLADVDDLEAAAETYGYGYHGQAPTRVLADLVADLEEVRPLLKGRQPVSQVRVWRAAGQMTGMTAIILHDLGERTEARAWFASARGAAAQSGDRHLRAWVLAREAMVPLNYGAPKAAAELAEKARHAAGARPTAAAALAAAVAARAYALSHRKDQAHEALRAADVFMERLDEGQRADTWLTHGEQKHHVHLSHALTALGETKRARESQERALELSAPTSSMTRTLLTIDGAVCAHHDGDTDDACKRTVDALAELPAAYRTGLVQRRALALYRSIPAQRHHVPAVRELRDVLAAA